MKVPEVILTCQMIVDAAAIENLMQEAQLHCDDRILRASSGSQTRDIALSIQHCVPPNGLDSRVLLIFSRKQTTMIKLENRNATNLLVLEFTELSDTHTD